MLLHYQHIQHYDKGTRYFHHHHQPAYLLEWGKYNIQKDKYNNKDIQPSLLSSSAHLLTRTANEGMHGAASNVTTIPTIIIQQHNNIKYLLRSSFRFIWCLFFRHISFISCPKDNIMKSNIS